MRTYPRSGLRSGGTSERTLVPVFVPGNIRQNHPFGNHLSGVIRANRFARIGVIRANRKIRVIHRPDAL